MIEQTMTFPDFNQTSSLISEAETLTGSKIFVLLSDMFRPPDEKSIDLAMIKMEQAAIQESETYGGKPNLLLLLQGGARFSRNSLLKMKILSQRYSLKMMLCGNTASLFTAFLTTNEVIGNREMYMELATEMYNVPAEDLILDFQRAISNLSFLPLNEVEIQNLILKNNVTRVDCKSDITNIADLTGLHGVFLRYLKSIERIFNFDESILGRNLGFEPINPVSINYKTHDMDLKKLSSLLSELSVKFSNYIAIRSDIFLSFLGSNFTMTTSNNSGVWE